MITATGPRVPGIGPLPCDVMIVGEGPGEQEAEGFWRGNRLVREPFVGASGAAQDRFLMMNGLHRHRCYITNLIKNWIPGNGNPTADDIAAQEGELLGELAACLPRFILAVGAFATRWFLGEHVDMESVHGHPYSSDRWLGATVIPCFHPAFGLRDSDANVLVWWDYQQAAAIIRGELSAVPVRDDHPDPRYYEPTIQQFWDYLEHEPGAPIAVDVEGSIEYRDEWWGFSVSKFPGTGLVVRRTNSQFDSYVGILNAHFVSHSPIVVYHNFLGIDADILRRMGAYGHTKRGHVFDTMLAAFFLRVEPQGLKALARRHCAMEMRTYEEVIGDAATAKEVEFLVRVGTRGWQKPEPRLVYENDGTVKVYKPQALAARAEKILTDWGNDPSTDLTARWRKVDEVLRAEATSALGPWPWATLDDTDLNSAIQYSGRDPDATIRIFYNLTAQIYQRGLTDRLWLDQRLMPVFDEMQQTGFIASRAHFERLSRDMWDDMMTIGQQISHRFNEDRPFNPNSPPQVAALAEGRGLKGAKRSKKTHKISTSKKSMEHLRRTDEAMDMVFRWRERETVKSSFADPTIERIPAGQPYGRVTCSIRTTRTNSDRISAQDPNLTGIPVDKGQENDPYARIRAGFGAPPGMLLGGADLSQIEMRVIADESNDPFMKELFHEERDIHAETAIKIFHLDPTRTWDANRGEFLYPGVHKTRHRNPTKRAGFGVGTGIQGPGLLDQLRQMGCEGWSVAKFNKGRDSDCVSDWCPRGIIHEWFEVFPSVKGFFQRCKDEAYKKGYVTERGGFPRYLPSIWSRDEYTAAEAGRQSHSHVIQGTAQWMLRVAMDWIAPEIERLREDSGLYCAWVLQIHDEIIFCFDPALEEEVKRIALDGLVNHTPQLSVPIKASWSTGITWDKLK